MVDYEITVLGAKFSDYVAYDQTIGKKLDKTEGLEFSYKGDKLKTNDGWSVEIDHNAPGRIIAIHDDGNGNQKRFRLHLNTGTIRLQSLPVDARWVELVTPATLLKQQFQITGKEALNPNRTFEGYHSIGDGTNEDMSAIVVVSDGKVKTTLLDDPDGTFSELTPDDWYYYQGDVCYEVSGATWAIVVEQYSVEDGFFHGVTLYTKERNLHLLAVQLDEFLQKEGVSGFTDYIQKLTADR